MFDGLDQTVQALFVAPRDLLAWAARIRPHIEKMAEKFGGRYEPSDLFAAMADGRILLWVALEGAQIRCVMIGEIMNYPRMRALRITGLVGNSPRKWKHLLPAVEDQARRQFGCSMMEASPQRKHMTIMPGYSETHLLCEKRL